MANWVKTVLGKAGIDISTYAPHCIRSASSSKAYQIGVSIHTIMKRAGWTRRNTFIDHYLKDVMPLQPDKNIESLVDGPVPDLPCISDNHHPEHAVHVEAELDRARRMKTFAQLWESDPLGEGGSSNVAEIVSAFTQCPLVEVTRGSAVRNHSPDREEFCQRASPHLSSDSLPPLSLTDEDDFHFFSDNISTVSSMITDTLPDSPLAPPPGWGDEPEHVIEPAFLFVPISPKEKILTSTETRVQGSDTVGHIGKGKKDKGFTTFCEKIINTPTGKIHKISIVRKPLDALSKLAANPCQGFEKVKIPAFEKVTVPVETRKKEYTTEACVVQDFPVNASGERIVEIELETGSEACSNPVPLPVIQDELGNIQVVHADPLVQKYGSGDSQDIIDHAGLGEPAAILNRSSQSQVIHFQSEVPQQRTGGIPVEKLNDGSLAQTPEAIPFDRIHNGFLTGDSADLDNPSAPPAQEPDYDRLSDEVTTTSGSAPKGVPIDHVDLVAKTRQAVKMWRCKLCGRLYGHRASLLMHLNVHQGFKPFSCPDCKISFYYKWTFTLHRCMGCIRGSNLGH